MIMFLNGPIKYIIMVLINIYIYIYIYKIYKFYTDLIRYMIDLSLRVLLQQKHLC